MFTYWRKYSASTSNKVPTGRILVVHMDRGYRQVAMAQYIGGEFYLNANAFNASCVLDVTHWRPYPAAPLLTLMSLKELAAWVKASYAKRTRDRQSDEGFDAGYGGGKLSQSQVEFFATMDRLYGSKKQCITTEDAPQPKE